MAITATFSAGILSVFGDALDNTTTISRNAAGQILVNGGAVSVKGGTPTVANTNQIQVFGLAGKDNLTLDESSGALPRVNLFGGGDNDNLIGGSGADQLFGQAGNDALLGKGGVDFLFGGADNDVLTGGDADDQMFGEAGNDRMIWNPGDDNDLMEGGAGTDTAEVNGGNGAETFTVTANGQRVRFDRVNPAPFSIDIGTTENLVLNANGGDDLITASNGLAAQIRLTVDGGTGNDTINGGDGNDFLLGGDGNDQIDGNRGNDVALMGAGDDLFIWDPGDGNDVLEGQAGKDIMRFNGANISENIDLSANGGRLRFFRDVANVIMDTNDVEQVDFNALGGADNITVKDLSGTDVKQIHIDLAGTIGGASGDGQIDRTSLNGTNGNDTVDILNQAGQIAVVGLSSSVTLKNTEGNDQLSIQALGGNDKISAATNGLAARIKLTVDGGTGNDTINGGDGNDMLLGGEGKDQIDGNRGDDVAFLGAGDDLFIWDPGDGSDVVEGQAGKDVMRFNGANVSENIDLSANGQRLRFFRDVANIVMDTNELEQVDFKALGGADTITVNDLSGTDVKQVNLDLSASGGTTGDSQVDTVIVHGTAGNDSIQVSSTGQGVIKVTGLSATVAISRSEGDRDRLTIHAGAGNDAIDARTLGPNLTGLTIDGELGQDTLHGSAGADTLLGGAGNDLLISGNGADQVTGGNGQDAFRFNFKTGGVDTITDFVAVDDTIQILASGFDSGLKSGTLDANRFVLGAAAKDGNDRFIYNNGALFFDADGIGKAAQVQIATLTGAPTLTNADIVIV